MPFEPKFQNLVQLYTESVQKFATRPLFGVKQGGSWKWLTYAKFGQRVDRVRGGLASLDLERGQRVAVIANNRPEWAIAAYAAYGLGASVVPMYESQLDKDWKFILNDCGASILIVANEEIQARIEAFREELPTLQHLIVMDGSGSLDCIAFEALETRGEENPTPAIFPDGEEIAGFVYTSGTTGQPKGVLLSHCNLASNVSAIHEIFPMSPEDRSLSFLPWAHSFGQTVELHTLLSMGASMGIAEAVDKIIANLAEVQPTLLFSVPRIFNRIYDGLHKKMDEAGGIKKWMFEAAMADAGERKRLEAAGRSSLVLDLKLKGFDRLVFSKVRARFGGRLRYAFSGGAALSKEVAEFVDNLGIMVYEGYGLTETSPIATTNYPGHRKIGSIGKAIPGVTIEIDKTVTGDAVNGEIVIYGHNVMQGYYGLDEENKKVLLEKDGMRGFRSGDMGRVDDDGFVFITGRLKEQYKLLNGKYVVPSPLEEQLKLSSFVSNVMVYGDNQNYNIALIIPDMDTLRRWGAEESVDVSSVERLNQDESVQALYQDELDMFSGSFKQYEKCKRFTFGGEDFTTENGMLTPTMKLKRRIVIDHYRDQLLATYK